MKKLNLHYKLTKLKWQMETLVKRLSFKSLLFKSRVKRLFVRKDVESEYPHLCYHDIKSYKSSNHNYTENPELSSLDGFRLDEVSMIYGRLIK